jgi:hypothetical protein
MGAGNDIERAAWRREKAIADATARLAMLGAQCHETKAGGFIVLVGGLVRSFSDLPGLQSFVASLGGRAE